MDTPFVRRLSEAEEDALIVDQAAMIGRLVARITELEALVGKVRKNSSNSHLPPSQDGPGRPSAKAGKPKARKPRPSRPGVSRSLAAEPDRTEQRSDETVPRVDGTTHWQWVFHSDQAVLHQIVPSRGRAVAEQVLGNYRPQVWVSDRYAGQQGLGQTHQVCLAHVLRDVQYAIDRGDSLTAPKIRDHLRWAIRIGKRRPSLNDSTLTAYAAKAERGLDALLGFPASHPAGRDLQRQIKAWRTKFFVFMTDRRVPPPITAANRKSDPPSSSEKLPTVSDPNGDRPSTPDTDPLPEPHACAELQPGTPSRPSSAAPSLSSDQWGCQPREQLRYFCC